jgi:hypothetical protein
MNSAGLSRITSSDLVRLNASPLSDLADELESGNAWRLAYPLRSFSEVTRIGVGSTRGPSTDGKLHHPLLAGVSPCELASDPPLPHHKNSVTHPQDLGQVGRN